MRILEPEDWRSITGAWRLARFDRTGFDLIDRTREGALRSFRAAVLIFPIYCLLTLLGRDEGSAALSLRLVAVELIAYVVNVTAFAVLMITISQVLNRWDRYFGYLTAYNWSAVVQVGFYLPAILVSELAIFPGDFGGVLVFAVTMTILVYQAFIARVALDLGNATAAILVLIDLVLAILISSVADGLLRVGEIS